MKKLFTLLTMLIVAITSSWAITPVTKTYGSNTFLDVTNTTKNVTVGTTNYVTLLRADFSGAWYTGGTSNTGTVSGNFNAETMPGFFGDSGWNAAYTIRQASGYNRPFFVTGTTGVAILGNDNSSSDANKKLNIVVEEVAENGDLTSVGSTAGTGNTSVYVLEYTATTLAADKYYKITITATGANTGNNRLAQIRFTQPSSTPAGPVDPDFSLSADEVEVGSTISVNGPAGLSFNAEPVSGTTGAVSVSGGTITGVTAGAAQVRVTSDATSEYNAYDHTFEITVKAPAVKYSVEYKLNGGSGDAPTQASLAEGSVFTVASAEGIIAPDGKVFKCWNDGSADYAPGADYTMGTSNVTLTAQWLTSSDATFTDGQYAIGGSALDLNTLFTSSSDGAVTYSVKSAGKTGAAIAIDGTSFTATEAGTATVTATQAATATYAGATLDATITVGKTTGANTITYTLDVTTGEDKNKTDINSTNVSSSLYVNSLVGITNNTSGSYTKGSKANLTVKIPTQASYDESKYMSVGFSVNSGYVFVPSSISVNAQPVTTNKAVKLVLTDGTNSIEKTEENVTAGSIKTVTMSNEDNVSFSGNVTLKIYCYGATDTYRLGSPITVDGTVLPAPKEITLSETDGKTKGFATFCGSENFTVSGASAYKASINEDKIVLTPLGNEETVISAEAGIIIAGDKGATATVTYTTDDATAEMSGNSLKGTTARVATSTLKNSTTDKVVGFFKSSSAFKSYTGEKFPANLAYFLLTAENAVESFDIVFDGETAINSIDANDNANSVAPVKVIKNGKLYIGNYNVAGQLVK